MAATFFAMNFFAALGPGQRQLGAVPGDCAVPAGSTFHIRHFSGMAWSEAAPLFLQLLLPVPPSDPPQDGPEFQPVLWLPAAPAIAPSDHRYLFSTEVDLMVDPGGRLTLVAETDQLRAVDFTAAGVLRPN